MTMDHWRMVSIGQTPTTRRRKKKRRKRRRSNLLLMELTTLIPRLPKLIGYVLH